MSAFAYRRSWGPHPRYPSAVARKRREGPLVVLAGPCSVESVEQIDAVVPLLAESGATFARGGVYRAGTYPGEKFGYQETLAWAWASACHAAGLKVVMECLDVRLLEKMAGLADAIQIGARHMQDYALLAECSKLGIPVFLKRNMGSTLDEFLGAAEYLCRGHCEPYLIERGSSTYHNHVRWDLSISIIPAAREASGLPILVDASHGTGRRDLVRPMTLAGIAAGADGFLVEVHPTPDSSLSDADQAYPISDLPELIGAARAVRAAAER